MQMRDIDVRIELIHAVCADFAEDPGTLVIEEFVAGDSRIDLAVVNGALHGYEIKSNADTLIRLPAQIASYGSVFDYVTLVAGERHLSAALKACPEWWGVLRAGEKPDKSKGVQLSLVRAPCQNPDPDPVSIAWLLWRAEALMLLNKYAVRGVARKSRGHLAKLVADRIPLLELRSSVRDQLRERSKWRPDAVRM